LVEQEPRSPTQPPVPVLPPVPGGAPPLPVVAQALAGPHALSPFEVPFVVKPTQQFVGQSDAVVQRCAHVADVPKFTQCELDG